MCGAANWLSPQAAFQNPTRGQTAQPFEFSELARRSPPLPQPLGFGNVNPARLRKQSFQASGRDPEANGIFCPQQWVVS